MIFKQLYLDVNKQHLLPLVLGEVEDDDVRAVPPLREGQQLPALVHAQRGEVLPPGAWVTLCCLYM